VKVKVKQHEANTAPRYCVYYPDEGRYSMLMTLREAKQLVKQFEFAYIVNAEDAEVIF
jgi:hypothetical protein